MPTPKRGKQQGLKYNGDGWHFETDQGFESLFMLSGPVKTAVAAEVAKLTMRIIKEAPKAPHFPGHDTYAIRKNIHANIERIDSEWVGYITIEENPRARHAMLQEQGYTGRDGHRHAGRFFIKGVLERERIE